MQSIKIYIFDTCSINRLQWYEISYNNFSIYWTALEHLMEDHQFFCRKEVLNEIDSGSTPSNIRDWIEVHKTKIELVPEDIYSFLAEIMHENPNLGNKNLERPERYHTDPHVIALTMDLPSKDFEINIISD